MLKKRIIPCLDIKNGRTVKGVNFVNIRDAGDPVELGALYAEQGADELVFLDITATNEGRKTFKELVKDIAKHLNIPFTVGGGISHVEDVAPLLYAGADKVSINSSAVKRPELIDELVAEFGSQCIVAAIDARYVEGKWIVHTHGGSKPTDKELFSWAKEVEQRGAGEILFTSMDHDGTKQGFANEALSQMASEVSIPIIASGGAGTMPHFKDVFEQGKADAALAASIFHFKEIGIQELKKYLKDNHIAVR
ncbi:imidazole glycerol phosphate synthase subunit HisF [Fulvivirga sediminis]|uniref:Imidazole glycerol phosphate synthase subunit HisF n=1 Tax=Fulvivirga sediminis TaxID=2803949 RepID=A0A937FAG8_9BACT|nr:imidazole glycerol phosphate synthase subunit HisF [Fulvivirga sediminis]MBL3658670.1 imidazole glycerol phosphate synthase subunit HisF [Fulvivirga sediminis]